MFDLGNIFLAKESSKGNLSVLVDFFDVTSTIHWSTLNMFEQKREYKINVLAEEIFHILFMGSLRSAHAHVAA